MEDRTKIKSKCLLIVDMDNIPESDIETIPMVLLPLYIEEMESHAEDVFGVQFKDGWESID